MTLPGLLWMYHFGSIVNLVRVCWNRFTRQCWPGALETRGLHVERQKVIRFVYDGMVFEGAFRIDLLVENQVIVELKSVETLVPVHKKKLLTYLRLTDKRVGLLLNFGSATLKEGLHSVVNGFPPTSPRLRASA